jgi:hypothetical protein
MIGKSSYQEYQTCLEMFNTIDYTTNRVEAPIRVVKRRRSLRQWYITKKLNEEISIQIRKE